MVDEKTQPDNSVFHESCDSLLLLLWSVSHGFWDRDMWFVNMMLLVSKKKYKLGKNYSCMMCYLLGH